MKIQDKSQISLHVYKCYLKCPNSNTYYSFALKIGQKISIQSKPKLPSNKTLIEFNQHILLKISQEQIFKNDKCQILLYKYQKPKQFDKQQKYKQNSQQNKQKQQQLGFQDNRVKNSCKQILGIATVNISDLQKRQKRNVRFINKIDKCAIIQLLISLNNKNNRCKSSQTNINKSSQPNNSYQQYSLRTNNQLYIRSNKNIQFYNHRRNHTQQQGIHSHRLVQNSQINKKQHQYNIYDNISKASATKTCPILLDQKYQQNNQANKNNQVNKNHQVNREIRFSRNKQIKQSHLSQYQQQIINPTVYYQKSVQKYHVNNKQQQKMGKNNNKTNELFINENNKRNINSQDKIEKRLNIKFKKYSQNINVMTNQLPIQNQLPIIKNQLQIKTKQNKLSNTTNLTLINQNINLHIKSYKNKKHLLLNPGLVNISINYNYQHKQILIQRQANTEHKYYINYGINTQTIQFYHKQISTADLFIKLQQSIQTILINKQQQNLQQQHKGIKRTQSIQSSKQSYPINSHRDLFESFGKPIQNKFSTKYIQTDFINRYKIQKQVQISIQKFPRRYSLQSSQITFLGKNNLSIQSNLKNNLPPPVQLNISKNIPTMYHSNKQIHIKQSFMNQQSSSKLFEESNNFLNDNSNISLIQSQIQSNSQYSKQNISLIENQFKFSIVRTVGIRIKSLRQQNNKVFWSSIKSGQNTKSKFERIGYVKPQNIISSFHPIQQVNESLSESKGLKLRNSNQMYFQNINFQLRKSPQKKYRKFQINLIHADKNDLDVSEVIYDENSFSQQTDEQIQQQYYSIQKDTKILTKIKKSFDTNNYFDLKQAKKFLQNTNKTISDIMRQTQDSFSIHLEDCKNNYVSKQQFDKVSNQLKQIEQQLKNIQASQIKLLNQKSQLDLSKIQSQKQIAILKSQNNKLTQNFKLLKMEYHTLVSEYLQKQQITKSMLDSQKRHHCREQSQTPRHRQCPQTPSNQLKRQSSRKINYNKSQRSFYDKPTDSIKDLNYGNNGFINKYNSTSQIGNKNNISLRRNSISSQLEFRTSSQNKVEQQTIKKQNPFSKMNWFDMQINKQKRKQRDFRSFVQDSVGNNGLKRQGSTTNRSLMSIGSRKGGLSSIKLVSGQSEFLSRFPSTMIQDLINNQRIKL